MSHPIPDAALERAVGIVGTTGAGKTYVAKGCVERLLDQGRRTCIVDPTGVWYGLRARADAEPGYPVAIFGGDHADIPITEDSALALAELIGGGDHAAIVDVSEMSMGGRVRFLTEFLTALYTENRRALHLVLDEADEMAPQSPMPETRRLLHAVDRIVRRGRVRGFRPMMITQRPAVIHKNVLSQIGTLIALKLTSPQDRKAVEDWVKGNADASQAREVVDSLPTLDTGEGWVWSPADDVLVRTQFPAIQTLDTSATPDADSDAAGAATLAPIDIDAISAAFAEAGASEAALDEAAQGVDRKVVEKAEKAAYERGFADGRHRGAEDERGRWAAAVRELAVKMGGAAPDEPTSTSAAPPAPKPVKAKPRPASDGALPASAMPWLEVMARVEPMTLTWASLAIMIGKKARGGHFNTVRRAILEGGYARDSGSGVSLTENGWAEVGGKQHDDRGLMERLIDALPTLPADIVRTLRDSAYPMTTEQIAEVLGKAPRGGYWNTGMRILRDGGIIAETGPYELPAWLKDSNQ